MIFKKHNFFCMKFSKIFFYFIFCILIGIANAYIINSKYLIVKVFRKFNCGFIKYSLILIDANYMTYTWFKKYSSNFFRMATSYKHKLKIQIRFLLRNILWFRFLIFILIFLFLFIIFYFFYHFFKFRFKEKLWCSIFIFKN